MEVVKVTCLVSPPEDSESIAEAPVGKHRGLLLAGVGKDLTPGPRANANGGFDLAQ